MKTGALVLGMLTGMTVAFTAVSVAYPDVYRRAMRDGKRIVKKGKKLAKGMC